MTGDRERKREYQRYREKEREQRQGVISALADSLRETREAEREAGRHTHTQFAHKNMCMQTNVQTPTLTTFTPSTLFQDLQSLNYAYQLIIIS